MALPPRPVVVVVIVVVVIVIISLSMSTLPPMVIPGRMTIIPVAAIVSIDIGIEIPVRFSSSSRSVLPSVRLLAATAAMVKSAWCWCWRPCLRRSVLRTVLPIGSNDKHHEGAAQSQLPPVVAGKPDLQLRRGLLRKPLRAGHCRPQLLAEVGLCISAYCDVLCADTLLATTAIKLHNAPSARCVDARDLATLVVQLRGSSQAADADTGTHCQLRARACCTT
mmetsp:Transcript_28261/g.65594  ORF Transcript_28261/g.65594 Transcript_28261/m.65594 type:complete len:222 (+) Transcript_28261:383-1048(+)